VFGSRYLAASQPVSVHGGKFDRLLKVEVETGVLQQASLLPPPSQVNQDVPPLHSCRSIDRETSVTVERGRSEVEQI